MYNSVQITKNKIIMRTKEIINGIEVFRVNNDVNGNPRYVIHFMDIANDYKEARRRANSIGGRVYTAEWFGGGFVFQSYNINKTVERIIKIRREANEL